LWFGDELAWGPDVPTLIERLCARLRRKSPARANAARPPAALAPSWRAVSVVPALICCHEVRAYTERRYLVNSTDERPPPLPVPGCSEIAECRCCYRHHRDRRAPAARTIRAGFEVVTHPWRRAEDHSNDR
jgi:hypothetical protein